MSLKPVHAAIQWARDATHKGRGAGLNIEGRFEVWQREPLDDGWHPNPASTPDELDTASRTPKTIVTEEIAKSILSKNDSPDISFRYSVNPYRGCEHGCIYCFARPSHAYLGLSPGLDFETRLFAKTNAPALLREALTRTGYRCDVITLGINTDAYQPVERRYRLTRQLLEIMREARQPVALITKSALIERDIDLLADMASDNLVHVTISLTTLNHDISRFLEPRTAAPRRRLETIARLAQAGVPVGVNVAPVIPVLTDSELEQLLTEATTRGARHAGYVLLRLPWEVKPLFRDWLQRHFPLKAAHVMSRLNEMRGGHDNDPRFGTRMTGDGLFAKLLAQRFARICAQLHLNQQGRSNSQRLDTSHFRAANLHGQAALF